MDLIKSANIPLDSDGEVDNYPFEKLLKGKTDVVRIRKLENTINRVIKISNL
jgi:hypothetical protein